MEIKITLKNLLQQLNKQAFLSNEQLEAINNSNLWQKATSAWYIRLMMVFGAWIASIFFLLAIFIAELVKSAESALVMGIIWIMTAVFLRRKASQTFPVQLALALSVAGHIMFCYALADIFNDALAAVISMIVLAVVLYPLYKDVLHRFLSPLSAIAFIIFWVYDEKFYWMFHILILVEIIVVAILFTNAKIKSDFRPLAYAFAVAIPSTLLLILIGEPIRLLFRYNNWISFDWLIAKIMFSVALLWLYQWALGSLERLKQQPILFGVIATLILGFISTPGLLAALWLMILGYSLRDYILIALAIAFFPVFITIYYYNLDLTLDIKSYILMASGIVLLLMRWYLSKFKAEEKGTLSIFPSSPINFRSPALWSTLAALIVILFVVNAMIIQKEGVLASGKTVLLRLAPVDPRSLIQGDYMVLDYEISRQFTHEELKTVPREGNLVIKIDTNNVATFLRFHKGETLNPGEHLLYYRVKVSKYFSRMQLGAESFFFQEGHAKYYETARYGELKIDAKGNSVLAGLRGEKFEVLKPTNEAKKASTSIN
ncbi:MAG: GDYXXLXY domain-containing protein [Acidobacteria bacterium]|nr:GDYXXLXY domain-containing protein [Acidobacteriota bacterium]